MSTPIKYSDILPFDLKPVQDYTDDDLEKMESVFGYEFTVKVEKLRNILNRKKKINNILSR